MKKIFIILILLLFIFSCERGLPDGIPPTTPIPNINYYSNTNFRNLVIEELKKIN